MRASGPPFPAPCPLLSPRAGALRPASPLLSRTHTHTHTHTRLPTPRLARRAIAALEGEYGTHKEEVLRMLLQVIMSVDNPFGKKK